MHIITYLLLLLLFRMSGAVLLLPPHTASWRGLDVYLLLFIYMTILRHILCLGQMQLALSGQDCVDNV